MQNTNNRFNDTKIVANHMIKYTELRLIDENKVQLGVMKTSDALKLAISKELDLIEINPKAAPPVCCIGNINKHMYEQKQKVKLQVKQTKALAKAQELKEINLRPVTGDADLKRKLSDGDKFLLTGHRIRFSVLFKGREQSHMHMDMERISSVISENIHNGDRDGTLSYSGNRVSIDYIPKKKGV